MTATTHALRFVPLLAITLAGCAGPDPMSSRASTPPPGPTTTTPRFDMHARPIYRNGGDWGEGTADYSHAFSGWGVQAAWPNGDGSYTVIRNADGSNDPRNAVQGIVRPRADGTIDDSAGWRPYEVGW